MNIYRTPRFLRSTSRSKRSRRDEDEAHSGRPLSSTTQENIKQVRSVICKGRQLTIPVVDKILGIDKESVQRIFHYNFNMKQVYTKMVPMILSPEQKVSRMKICADIFKTLETDPMSSVRVITYDESWFLTFDPETKWHQCIGIAPRQKKLEEQIEIQSHDDCDFNITMVLFT